MAIVMSAGAPQAGARNQRAKRKDGRADSHAFASTPTARPGEPVDPEATDIVFGPAVKREVGQDFADHACELEAMARAGRGQYDTRIGGRMVDQEELVGRAGVDAGRHASERPVGGRHIGAENAADLGFVLGVTVLFEAVRILQDSAFAVGGGFYARAGEVGKPVAGIVLRFDYEDGKALRPDQVGFGGLEPAEHLAGQLQVGRKLRREAADPGAGRHDDPVRLDRRAIDPQTHGVRPRFDCLNLRPCPHHTPVAQRLGHEGAHGLFRLDEPAVWLEQAMPMLRQPKRGKPLRDLSGIEHLVREMVQSRGFERALHDGRTGVAHLQNAGHGKQLFAARRLERAPVREGRPEQGHIGRVFEIRQSDRPAFAMRRSLVMTRLEPLDADHPNAAPC